MAIFNTVLFLATAVTAMPQVGSIPGLKPFMAPGPNDSRGPCPMVNTLANHGYLPRDGRNVTAADFGVAVAAALNVDEGFGTLPAQVFSRGFKQDYFDIEDLNTPGVMQHVASLTRRDVTDDDSSSLIDLDRLQAFLDNSPTEFITANSVATTRLQVEKLSLPRKLSFKESPLAFIEATLALVMMMDQVPDANTSPVAADFQAPKERVAAWLKEERLPVELGWRPFPRKVVAKDLLPPMKAIYGDYVTQRGGPNLWERFLFVIIRLIGI